MDEATTQVNDDSEEKRRSNGDDFSESRSSKFRFKKSSKLSTKRSSTAHDQQADTNNNDAEARKHHHRRRHHHHKSSRHSAKRQKTENSPISPDGMRRSLSPETAFRESLFDALGDDEGAMYWESVYGQPIHTYAVPSVPKGPNGELERMTDEEYAEYVRARMWERSHEGIMQERERQRRENAKKKQRAEKEQWETQTRARFNEALDESLKRGEARKRAKARKAAWEKYLQSWEDLSTLSKDQCSGESGDALAHIRKHLHWPVTSGKRRDLTREEVKTFMQNSPLENYLSTLKSERVRWHPDKMLHRYGGLGLGEEKSLVKSITEVFQILDDLWIEEKERNSS